jgi:isopentenyl diphosphate isomerase/L-lactate dehydrogenase-like FMN-dependent dehydrogenase
VTDRPRSGRLARRRFLQFICASPLYAGIRPLLALADGQDPDRSPLPDELLGPVESPDRALDVFDFQRVAQQTLPPAHYGYLATGTDGNETLRANREAFGRLYLRAMRMVDTSNIDTRLDLLGSQLTSPIVIAPAGSQRAFHDEGELATARAARQRGHLQILSNVSTHGIEDVIAARGAPVWFQLYPTQDFDVARAMVARAERAGAGVLVLTVDLNADSNRVALARYIRQDTRECRQCHDLDRENHWLDRKPMYFETGADASRFETPEMTWDYLERLRAVTTMKLVVKGIVTAEDATAAVRHGVDAVYVSNHGGRAEASGWATLDSLPEVVAAVDGKVPIMVDSGFRRGSDIFKALALGADAVCIGRPYLWGLAAFGQAGVERVLELLQAELLMVMRQMGAARLSDIRTEHVGRHPITSHLPQT